MATKIEKDRTRFILGAQMSSAVMGMNSIFCTSGEKNETELVNEPGFIYEVAKTIAIGTSRMALEDAIAVLTKALEVKEKENI